MLADHAHAHSSIYNAAASQPRSLGLGCSLTKGNLVVIECHKIEIYFDIISEKRNDSKVKKEEKTDDIMSS